MTRVLLVDDHAMVRAGLAALIEAAADLELAGEASDGSQAVEMVARSRPDVVLMDLSMPVMDGVTATRAVLATYPDVRVLVLTSLVGPDQVRDVLGAGACGYLLKESDPAELIDGIRAVAGGGTAIDPRVAAV